MTQPLFYNSGTCLLEDYGSTKEPLEVVNNKLAAAGLIMRERTIDAAIIAAPPSLKDRKPPHVAQRCLNQEREPVALRNEGPH